MEPQTHGRFEVIEPLQRGPLGREYLARDPTDGRRVVVQLIEVLQEVPADERIAALRRMSDRAGTLRELDDPAIGSLIEVAAEAEPPRIVRGYFEAPNLESHLRPGSLLPPQLALQRIANAADALAVAHDRGLVHGNLTPSNLFCSDEGRIRLSGFDLTGLIPSRLKDATRPDLTPAYLAPEQVRGAVADPRSDLFSLTAILYELMLGTPAFPGDTVASIVYRIVHEDARDPASFENAPGSAVSEFLRRGLSRQPDRRPANAREFASALRGIARTASAASAGVGETSNAATVEPALPPAESLPPRRVRRRSSRSPALRWAMLLVVLLGGAAAATIYFRPSILRPEPAPLSEVWLETDVRTEPEGLEVLLDGIPLDMQSSRAVRFRAGGPFGTLSISQGCRTVEHTLEAQDAGGETVLVADPLTLDWTLDPGIEGARAELNGKRLGPAPIDVTLDLCRDNALTLLAPRYSSASAEIASGATPVEARQALIALKLEPIPRGRIELPRTAVDLVIYLDGKRQRGKSREFEVEEGTHTVRLKNEYHWIDQTHTVQVAGGRVVPADTFRVPALAELVVQAFPANCKVYLRRPGRSWKYLEDTPLRRKLAVGQYQVKIEWIATGAIEERDVALVEGTNPPVRVSFKR